MSGEPPRIRPARTADAGRIASIHAQGIAERVATFETRDPSADGVEELIASGAIVVVAERAGEVVGFAKVGPYSDQAPYYSGVGELTFYVERGARRAGVGVALVEGVTRAAEARGYWKLVGKVFASNQASLELLSAQRWRVVGEHLRHGRLDGEWKDVILLERSLVPSDA